MILPRKGTEYKLGPNFNLVMMVVDFFVVYTSRLRILLVSYANIQTVKLFFVDMKGVSCV